MKITLAANWKMNMHQSDIDLFMKELKTTHSVNIILAAPYPYLSGLRSHNSIQLAAQNVYHKEEGAYTGEVSASMLADLDISHCIIGHSERRQYFGEDDTLIAGKADMLIRHKITPIICVGENLEQRKANKTLDIIQQQLTDIFQAIAAEPDIIIAYEPVWAIGTGQTATTEQAQEVHGFIRGFLKQRYTADKAANTAILYGGSMNQSNAKSLIDQKDINGGLIGSASLNHSSFNAIINAVKEVI